MSERTRPCDRKVLEGRLRKAEQFAEAAAVVDEWYETGSPDLSDAYVTLAVHAGIAAADVVCCAALGRHAAGENHAAAVALLASVGGDSEPLARSLGHLLALKTKAGYMHTSVSADDRRRAGRALERLLDGARLAAGGTGARRDEPSG